MGASTHTFKNCGCLSTHSTHTNEDPAQCFMHLILKQVRRLRYQPRLSLEIIDFQLLQLILWGFRAFTGSTDEGKVLH